MKKLLSVMTVAAALTLSACGTAHVHSYGDYVDGGADGHTRVCTGCGDEESSPHDMNGDVCTVCGYTHHEFGDWTYLNDDEHIRICAGCHAEERLAHDMTDGACGTCAYDIYDVRFERVDDTYTVAGLKNVTEERIVIPAMYRGLPVTAIKARAFENASFSEIVLPAGLLTIGERAFIGSAIESVDIPASVIDIGVAAFRDCTRLAEVTLRDGLETIGERAFCNCTRLREVVVPDTVTLMGKSAFDGCTWLTDLTLPFTGANADGEPSYNFGYIFGASSNSAYNNSYVPERLNSVVLTTATAIRDRAFYECRHITSITIPHTVTAIGEYAFHNCVSLANVVYAGTMSEWLALYNAADWSPAQGFTVHCTDGDLDKTGAAVV